jgi:TM2 domain-containing membrane protein YozV/Tfp pilus assembly major pilin PilA
MAETPKRTKSRTTTAILAILLGGLGVHRFYLGQWWGVFYLLFCWTLVPGIVALVEGIVLLFSSQERWDRKYNDGVATPSSAAGTAIGVVLALFGLVFMLGVGAGLVVPAYADYTTRAQVTEGLMLASEPKASVTAALVARGKAPKDRAEAGLAPQAHGQFVSSVDIADGRIDITYGGAAVRSISGRVLSITPYLVEHQGGAVEVKWRCAFGPVPAPAAREAAPYRAGDMPAKYLPSICRG